jgi:hypothetical protein
VHAGEIPQIADQHVRVREVAIRSVITRGDAVEILGTSTEEIRQLLARPRPAEDERLAQQDLVDAAFANRER